MKRTEEKSLRKLQCQENHSGRNVLSVRLLDVARIMENLLPEYSSSDGIHFDKPQGTEWLNGVFQKQINFLESDLV